MEPATTLKRFIELAAAALFMTTVILNCILAEASQPALPTAISGKVMYTNNTPSEGVTVEATWKDNSGTYQTSRTQTLTTSQANELGKPELSGSYFFNQGYIQAQEESEITLKASGSINTVKIPAAPGKDITQALNIMLPDPTDKTPPTISAVKTVETQDGTGVSFSTNEPATGTVRYGTTTPVTIAANNTFLTSRTVTLTDLVAYTAYVYEVTATDASGNHATDNNNGQYYRFTTGAPTGGSLGTGMGTPGSKATPNVKGGKQQEHGEGGQAEKVESGQGSDQESGQEFKATPNNLPTSIYGKLTDESGESLEDTEVVAKWTGPDGEMHTLTAETINKKEAIKLGDTELAGYYHFSKNLTLPAGTTVNITSPDAKGYKATATANPGGSAKAATITPATVKKASYKSAKQKEQPSTTHPTVQAQPAQKPIKINWLSKIPKPGKRFSQAAFSIGMLAALLLAGYSYSYYIAKRKLSAQNELGTAIKRTITRKAKSAMSKNIVSIDSEETLMAAARLAFEAEKGGIVVTSGSNPIGWVTEKTITEDVLLNGTSPDAKIKSATILKPLLINGNASLAEIGKQFSQSNAKKAIVIEGGKPVGVITVTDIAKALAEFTEKYSIESQETPEISSIMKQDITEIQREATLAEARQAMTEKNSDYAILKCEKPEDQPAILTEKNILEEIVLNPKLAYKAKARLAAKFPIKTIQQYVNLFEANSIMLIEKFRRLPITRQDKIAGIATQDEVVRALMNYLQRLTKTKYSVIRRFK